MICYIQHKFYCGSDNHIKGKFPRGKSTFLFNIHQYFFGKKIRTLQKMTSTYFDS